MEQQFTPPQYRDDRQPMSYGKKLLLLGLQCGVLMIGALAIWAMVYSREESNRSVSQEIARDWGEDVYISGPVIRGVIGSAVTTVVPENYNCNVEVTAKSLHRNIYEAEVFTAHVSLNGTFNGDSINTLHDILNIRIVADTRQMTMIAPLTVNGKVVNWSVEEDFLYASLDKEVVSDHVDFSTEFDIRGSSAIYIAQLGDRSSITIDGSARNPSFSGSSLPSDRFVSDGEFSARWTKDIVSSADDSERVGIRFLVGVSSYQKVSRSMKYAFMIILLTFASVLFTEMITKQPIPLTNYFLIGAALILFYSLLLSFSEHLSFGISYLISAFMTVMLITVYMWRMLRSAKAALSIGSILTGLYFCCYILLSLATYALLLGSMILFAALAAMMYGSLQVKH